MANIVLGPAEATTRWFEVVPSRLGSLALIQVVHNRSRSPDFLLGISRDLAITFGLFGDIFFSRRACCRGEAEVTLAPKRDLFL